MVAPHETTVPDRTKRLEQLVDDATDEQIAAISDAIARAVERTGLTPLGVVCQTLGKLNAQSPFTGEALCLYEWIVEMRAAERAREA